MNTTALDAGGGRSTHDVVVIGSLNVDYTTAVPSIPQPGETVLGGDVRTFMGGKGLNQAIAASRAGASVAMVGRIGNDDGGRRLRDRLRSDGVDDSWIGVDDRSPSGAAFITVDRNSENAIVVSPGANATLTADHVNAAVGAVERASVVLMQLEVPMAAVEAAVRAATGTVIVNPAPAPAEPLPTAVLEQTSILIPNRSELAALTGHRLAGAGDDLAGSAAMLLAEQGRDGAQIVVTLGSDGVLLIDRTGTRRFAARPVTAVDTTGAGDCFCGNLAARLAAGQSMPNAITWATTAAAISVTRAGASDSMPTAADVTAVL